MDITEICNNALTKLGAEPIMSVNDTTKEAKKCKLRYNPVRKLMLRRHTWNFAKDRVILSPTSTVPAFGFAYSYNLPADCVKFIGIEYDWLPWKYEGARKILANVDTLRITYIKDVSDPSQFDTMFAEAFACYLAWDICRSITDSATIRMEMADAYGSAIREAKHANAIENPMETIESDDFLLARMGGRTGGFVRDPGT